MKDYGKTKKDYRFRILDFAKCKVLVVEDADNWRKTHTTKLEFLEANVTAVDSVEAAVKALEQGKFTHVISDGLKGAYKQVVSAAQEAGVPTIIVVSASDIESEVKRSGANFVQKFDISTGKVGYEALLRM